ncbi:hypothetical protein [Chroococcidiopsis sp.]|uniref:hypothetical protein n=1 Tax=Chroococcidiopsis sp. TaxID=3088168 RepID=UPI003F679196
MNYKIPVQILVNSQPFPLTDTAPTAYLKKYHDGLVVHPIGVSVVDSALGKLRLNFKIPDTVKPGRYLFHLQILLSNGDIFTPLKGVWDIAYE